MKKKNKRKNPDDYDNDLVTKSLGKVGKGAIILFIGTAFGMLFNFLSRILIARFYTPADYGLFNLYFTILSIFAAIGAIGLRSGIKRNVAYYIGKDEDEKVPAVISWGLAIALVGGIVFGIVLFIFANPIASLFSEDPSLGDYYRLAAIAVPFYIFTIALISVFRGFQRTKERILFYDLGRNTLILIFIVTIGIFALPFENVIWGVTLSVVLIAISLFIWYLKIHKDELGVKKLISWDIPLGKELLLFSLPLVLVDISYRVMGWGDTMMIGYFMREDFVGYYQAAKPLSRFISTGLSVTLFIYGPLTASLYAQGKIRENEEIFTVLTKWICFGTLPTALIMIFYSRWILGFFFGADYTAAVVALQVLGIVYFINNFMGPNGSTLTAFGKTKFLMYATGGAATLNILLNGLLIPYYGITGAALATGLSLISINTIRVKKLKDISGIHPVRHQIVKPIIVSAVLSFILVYLLRLIFPVNLILVAISGISFYGIFLFSIIITKSFSNEDIKLLLMVEKKLGLNLAPLKKLFKKFI